MIYGFIPHTTLLAHSHARCLLCPAGWWPFIPNPGLLVYLSFGYVKHQEDTRGTPEDNKSRLNYSTQRRIKVYEVCDQLFTRLHALLTSQAGTFIETLFSVFVIEGKKNLQLSHVLFLWRTHGFHRSSQGVGWGGVVPGCVCSAMSCQANLFFLSTLITISSGADAMYRISIINMHVWLSWPWRDKQTRQAQDNFLCTLPRLFPQCA